MPLLTVFSAPKPFTDPHVATIQRNAMQSWLKLGPQVEVFLVGEETGLVEAASDYSLIVLAPVERNSSGTPLVRSVFSLARKASSSPILVFVNADIILMNDLVKAVSTVSRSLSNNNLQENKSFLMIGQRWDLEIGRLLEFSSGWEQQLKNEIRVNGQLHAPAGSDYFVFPREAFTEIPEFAIGRAGWDNWMIYQARLNRWPVIDATPSVMVIHQNHDYSHLPGGIAHYNQYESQQNQELAGGLSHMYMLLDATHQLSHGHLHKAPPTRLRVLRSFERWLMPEKNSLRGLRGGMARKFRRIRRGVD
ncbi:MAG: hypothetical protein A2Z16_04875 [Chloroflexi bacterium RBG_16_54_18]|nr:MAG: hypothetical protein A2Z16_04875 [Chloroflexi bacterium RBG_16_54_18]